MHEEIIRNAIAQHTDGARNASQTADGVMLTLKLLQLQLQHVVGVAATEALGAHAVHRTRSELAWTLPTAGPIAEAVFATVRDDLAGRKPVEVKQAGEVLLGALVRHLFSLIGEPLTYRMLHSAWHKPAADRASMEKFK